MAQWHDAGSSGSAFTASSLTFSYTTTSGATYLTVRVVNGQSSATTITGVTFNGTSMYLIGEQVDAIGLHRVSIWGLRSPAITTANVVVTASGSCDVIWAYARSADTVDTTSDASAHGTLVGENEAAGNLSLDVGSASSDLVIDVVGAYNVALTITGGQTSEANTNPGAGSTYVGASWEAAVGATTTVSWSGPSFYAYAAVAVKNGGAAAASPKRLSLLGVG